MRITYSATSTHAARKTSSRQLRPQFRVAIGYPVEEAPVGRCENGAPFEHLSIEFYAIIRYRHFHSPQTCAQPNSARAALPIS